MRILVVANFGRRRGYTVFYNVENKLYAGFLRAGHHAIAFSDRDVAEEASPFPTKWGGVAAMRRRLVAVATHYRPHFVLFGHTDRVDADTFEALRRAAPEARLAQFYVDPVHDPSTLAGFAMRAAHVDVSFVTTAERACLEPLRARPDAIRFFPNPVDSSIETARVFEQPREALALDGQFLGAGGETREDQLRDLESRLPTGFRFRHGGRSFGSQRVESVAYLDALAEAAMAPNLARDDALPVPFLYSSDRIAQLLGQGVAVLTPASGRQEVIYDNGVMPYLGREDLAGRMIELWDDDQARRRLAEHGWRIAHERTSVERVVRYMLEAAFEERFSETYGWPVDPIC